MTTSTLSQLADRYAEEVIAISTRYLDHFEVGGIPDLKERHRLMKKIDQKVPKVASRLIRMHSKARRSLDGRRIR